MNTLKYLIRLKINFGGVTTVLVARVTCYAITNYWDRDPATTHHFAAKRNEKVGKEWPLVCLKKQPGITYLSYVIKIRR